MNLLCRLLSDGAMWSPLPSTASGLGASWWAVAYSDRWRSALCRRAAGGLQNWWGLWVCCGQHIGWGPRVDLAIGEVTVRVRTPYPPPHSLYATIANLGLQGHASHTENSRPIPKELSTDCGVHLLAIVPLGRTCCRILIPKSGFDSSA